MEKLARDFIIAKSPTHVIHAAAQRFPDKVEADPEAAVNLNVESSRNIALACKVRRYENATRGHSGLVLTNGDVGGRGPDDLHLHRLRV